MRISDWSSDVCSSDLLVPSLLPLTFELRWTKHFYLVSPCVSEHLSVQQIKAAHLRRILVVSPKLKSLECRIIGTPYRYYRSEERSVGKECVSTCRSRGSPYN